MSLIMNLESIRSRKVVDWTIAYRAFSPGATVPLGSIGLSARLTFAY